MNAPGRRAKRRTQCLSGTISWNAHDQRQSCVTGSTFDLPAAGVRKCDPSGVVRVTSKLIRGDENVLRILAVCLAIALAACGCGREISTNPNDHGGTIARVAAKPYSYPLKASSNGRYLVDQDGRPFFIVGDSAQSAIANLTYPEAQFYLTDRASRGFNTVNVNLIEHKFGQGGKGRTLSGVPTNRAGDLPFTRNAAGGAYDGTWGTADFSAPNESYFAFADSIIDLAGSKGMLVSLAVLYLGSGGGTEGWWSDLNDSANTEAVCYQFGLYVGNRYKTRPNVFFVIGADYFPPPGSEGEKRLLKILDGAKAAGATQLWAGDWAPPSVSTDATAFAAAMGLNGVYAYGSTYPEARAAYTHTLPIPVYLKETGYEAEGWSPGDPASVRKYEWWAVLSGATTGLIFGHRDIWEFATASWWSGFKFGHAHWQRALDSPGSRDMQRMAAFVASIAWHRLVPSQLAGTKKLVTSCNGAPGAANYVPAAGTADGSLLLAYVPASVEARTQSLTIDMTAMGGPTRARWWNPTSGGYTEIGNSLANTGTREFTTPGDNSTGANDWLLVLTWGSAPHPGSVARGAPLHPAPLPRGRAVRAERGAPPHNPGSVARGAPAPAPLAPTPRCTSRIVGAAARALCAPEPCLHGKHDTFIHSGRASTA
jgi:hypothetical protein